MRGRDQQIECGQLGYKGHAVNVMQNIQSVATRLPRTVATLDYVVVRRRGADGAASRKFRVRREKVRGASEWLIANNPLYKDIRDWTRTRWPAYRAKLTLTCNTVELPLIEFEENAPSESAVGGDGVASSAAPAAAAAAANAATTSASVLEADDNESGADASACS